jgi:hypothetical protein
MALVADCAEEVRLRCCTAGEHHGRGNNRPGLGRLVKWQLSDMTFRAAIANLADAE